MEQKMIMSSVVLLRSIADDPHILEVGRKAIEDCLIESRNARLSILGVGNGLVIREKDGESSSLIRMTTWHALEYGIKAIADHIEKELARSPEGNPG